MRFGGRGARGRGSLASGPRDHGEEDHEEHAALSGVQEAEVRLEQPARQRQLAPCKHGPEHAEVSAQGHLCGPEAETRRDERDRRRDDDEKAAADVDPPGHLGRAVDKGLVPPDRLADLPSRLDGDSGTRRAASARQLCPWARNARGSRLRVVALLQRAAGVQQRTHRQQPRAAGHGRRRERGEGIFGLPHARRTTTHPPTSRS
eukprot:scaffold8997_cov116-Isochrysis_galbana.AAC.2